MVIDKKIKRTMLEYKAQYLGSLLLIIFSCMLYTMLNQLSHNLTAITSSFEKNYVQEDANFIADKKLSNISQLEAKFQMKLEENKTLDYPVSEDKTLRLFSQSTKVNLPAIIEGKNLSGSDILLDPAYAKANKLRIGDTIKVYDKNLKISGFVSLPNYIYPLKAESDIINDPSSFGIAVISKEDFKAINRGVGFYTLRFNTVGDAESKIAQLKDYLKTQNINVLKWTNRNENPRITVVNAKIEGQNKIGSTLPVAILLLTCILTGIVLWRMLKREFAIIGTLYALGYRKREIMRHYLSFPIFIALVGGIIGTILGFFTLRPMLNVMVSYFNMPIDSVSFYVQYALISLLLPIVLLAISGYFVVNKALKYTPVELMRGGKEKGKVSFLERKLKLDKLKFSAKFKIREQLRSLPRSTFLLLGVTLATMLLLLGFAAKSSMDYLMKDTYENVYKYQYMYVFNSVQRGTPAQGEAFSEIPITLNVDDKTSYAIFGISSDSRFISLKDKSGSKLSTGQVIVTRPLADRHKLKPGDTIQVVNKLDSRKYNITIDSVAETYVGSYIYMPLTKLNSMLGLPADSYAGLWSKDKLSIPEGKLLTTVTIDDFKKAVDSMTKPMQTYLATIAFFAFIIGLIVIYVVTSLIIEENKQSISLMKILGYRKKEVFSLILDSSSFLIVLGYILGVPLLLVSLGAMFDSITKSMNLAFPVTINYPYVIVGFVIIYFTYELSKFLSKKKINRISMAEALKAGLE